jgi:SAM-dependent MidA family methyltransferase
VDPALIAILALIASAIQVGILRMIDYYFPRGHTHMGDHILETKAERKERHKKLHDDVTENIDEDYDLTDPDE